jgi:hypothetical protein
MSGKLNKFLYWRLYKDHPKEVARKRRAAHAGRAVGIPKKTAQGEVDEDLLRRKIGTQQLIPILYSNVFQK